MSALDRYTRKTTAATTSGAQPATARTIGATSLLAPVQSRPGTGSGRAIGATTLAQAAAAPATAAAAAAAPAAEPQIDWFSQPFNLTHYTFALENDPRYANDPLVQAPGLNEPHREGFLYSDTGILMQGTGKASDGRYITVDWSAGGPAGRNTRFTYGVGGTGGTPVPWKTVASDPSVVPLGSRLVLEAYRSKGEFTANDTGGAINGHHLDVFVGAISIQEAFQLGSVSSRVGIIKSGSLGGGTAGQDQGQDHGDGDPGAPPVLRRGSTGADVERLQQRLGTAVDGDFGPSTERAVIAFQQSRGLDADGVVGPQTWAALADGGGGSTSQPDPTPSRPELRLGATGPDVIALQRSLAIQPTGTFGPTTEGIVKRFQQAHGLEATGVVDARTWAAIDSAASSAVITANPNSENVLVGTSGGILGDRLLPHSTNLDEVMPHHGAAGDRHELRAIEFDGAGNVATTTWPSSQAVPRVVIDGQEVRVTSRLPAPILRFIDGISATDFTVGKRSDPDNQAYDVGRPVYSPFDMKVTEVDAGAGFLALEKKAPLTLDLGNGRTAQLYERIAVLHLDTVLVATGQEVKAGEKIATQGNTGTRDVHQHIAGSNAMRIDFINAQTRAFAPAT